MTRVRRRGVASRIAGACLAWIMLVGVPVSRVASQQDVSEVADDDIVLPTVVLELDEPSSSGLEVALPVDIQVVAPELGPPLPEAGDLDIDLRTAVAAPAMEFTLAGDAGPAHTLLAETYVRVGTTIGTDQDAPAGLPLAQLDSGLSVLGTGPGGDFSLVFTHSLQDGIRNHRRPGEGAKTQRHALAGSVGLELGAGQFDAEASMVNSEHGFGFLRKGEDNGIDQSERRNSAETQAVAGAASYRIPLGDLVQLTPALDLKADSTTLTGRNPETHSELWAAPELVLDWDWTPLDLRVSARYLLRRYAELLGRATDEYLRHKVNADVTGSIDLGAQTGLELSLGWSWRTDEEATFKGHRFVPQAVISGTPTSWFTYRLAGGFEVRELGVGSVTERYPYVEPARVVDDDGWFAFGRAQFGLGEWAGLSELTIVASTRLATHTAALKPMERNRRSLYDLAQGEIALSVVPGLGLGLGFGDTLQIRANVSGEVLRGNAPRFAPLLQSEFEVEARTSDGGLGVRLNATMDYVEELGWQVPEVELEGLWRQGATTLTLSLTDILELADGPRRDWEPYLRPGFGAAVSVQLAL